MASLMIKDLDAAMLARLEAVAALQGTTVENFVRETLAAVAARDTDAAWLVRLRALRDGLDRTAEWNTVAEIRAGREGRNARVMGEDDQEAWAREYRLALQQQRAGDAA